MGGQWEKVKRFQSHSYLVQTIHFFRGVNDFFTSATLRIHGGEMLFYLCVFLSAETAGPMGPFEN